MSLEVLWVQAPLGVPSDSMGLTQAWVIHPTVNWVTVRGTTIERIAGGAEIVETWDTYDAMSMMQQLGVVPTRPRKGQTLGGGTESQGTDRKSRG